MMHDDLDRAHESLAAELAPDNCLEILRAAVCCQKAGKRLQSQERLFGGAQQAKGQSKAMETGGPTLFQRSHVVYGDDRITANPRSVAARDLDRFFPAYDINLFVLLQIVKQCEILMQNSVRRRIPARINNEDAKTRPGRALPGL